MTALISHEIGAIYFVIGMIHLIPLYIYVAEAEHQTKKEGVHLWLAIFFGWMIVAFWLPFWICYGIYWLSKRF
tara:strand:- start:511 stop:729 length:219 start_codon:yes stop_codon:yes gene_type:complete